MPPLLADPPWAAPLLLLLLPAGLFLYRRGAPRPWLVPTLATAAIGVLTAVLLLFAGPWAYTELINDLARSGMTPGVLVQLPLLLALLVGARAGGWLDTRRGAPAAMAPLGVPGWQVLAGSAAMGAGGILVPGANDQLLLFGLPYLAPHALLGLLAMVLAILALLRPKLARRISAD